MAEDERLSKVFLRILDAEPEAKLNAVGVFENYLATHRMDKHKIKLWYDDGTLTVDSLAGSQQRGPQRLTIATFIGDSRPPSKADVRKWAVDNLDGRYTLSLYFEMMIAVELGEDAQKIRQAFVVTDIDFFNTHDNPFK